MIVSMKYKATINGLRTRSQIGLDSISVLLSSSEFANNIMQCR